MAYNAESELLDTLNVCAAACSLCAGICLQEKGISALTGCIRLNADTAAICRLAAVLLSGRSGFIKDALVVCATACLACAKECDKHAHIEQCQECADACRVCAEICLQEAAR